MHNNRVHSLYVVLRCVFLWRSVEFLVDDIGLVLGAKLMSRVLGFFVTWDMEVF
jgi:hypothetical protein